MKSKTVKLENEEVGETADKKLIVRRKIGPDGYAICGICGVHLVNVEERIRCKYCWNCGTKVKWN